MKIKFKSRHNKITNDCWCDAIAFATHRTYEEVRSEMTPFINEDGGINSGFMDGAMFKAGYERWNVKQEDQTPIREDILHTNTYDNECVFMTDGHAVYVHKATIYDNCEIEMREKYLDDVVKFYYLREVKP